MAAFLLFIQDGQAHKTRAHVHTRRKKARSAGGSSGLSRCAFAVITVLSVMIISNNRNRCAPATVRGGYLFSVEGENDTGIPRSSPSTVLIPFDKSDNK